MKSACMGGFCAVRERCALYAAEGWARSHPADRLCEPGERNAFRPISECPQNAIPKEAPIDWPSIDFTGFPHHV